jgi:hypothetical protein
MIGFPSSGTEEKASGDSCVSGISCVLMLENRPLKAPAKQVQWPRGRRVAAAHWERLHPHSVGYYNRARRKQEWEVSLLHARHLCLAVPKNQRIPNPDMTAMGSVFIAWIVDWEWDAEDSLQEA